MHDEHDTHHDRSHLDVATTPRLAWLLLGLFLVAMIGCAGPAIRSQSPEIEALAALEADTKLIGDYAAPWGLNAQRIERAALVTGRHRQRSAAQCPAAVAHGRHAGPWRR